MLMLFHLLAGCFFAALSIRSEPYEHGYHYQSRSIHCVRVPDSDYSTKCTVTAGSDVTRPGDRCFVDFEPALLNIRSMCPTFCQYADSFEVVHKKPSNNHVCLKFVNYGLERREKDVYLWRRGKCMNETISFDVSCGFPFSRKDLKNLIADPKEYLKRLLA